MKQINGKWVVSLAFDSEEDAKNFRYMLSEGVCISPTGARTKRFTEVDPGCEINNTATGVSNGPVTQIGQMYGDISGKRVR